MKANPENVQAIVVGKKTHDKNLKVNLEGIEIECETEVKLLGVTIDFKLNFNEHISNTCTKSGCVALFRQPITPTTHYSDSPLLRRPIFSDNAK